MKAKAVVMVLWLGALGGAASSAREPLSFGERVKAQEALERVTYAHRIWPQENPQPKPSFEEMAPLWVLEAKVSDTLKKSAALGEFWQKPIRPEQVQAEMERMARDTKDPAMLRKLFAALGDDPYLIAECLARPALADRLLGNWYNGDDRIHGVVKAQAHAALEAALAGEPLESLCGAEVRRTLNRYRPEGAEALREEVAPGEVSVESEEEWRRLQESWPADGPAARLADLREGYVVQRLLRRTADLLETEEAVFAKEPMKSWLDRHPELSRKASPPDAAEFVFNLPNLAGREEDTCNNSWVHSSLNEVIDGRQGHTAVWTGTEMIIWGGASTSTTFRTGGRYSPSTDTWVPTNLENGPLGRSHHTAVWTGSEMIVWGGLDQGYLGTGGRYNPTTDSWTSTGTGTGCPTPRDYHSAVWTGTEMIVWGGYSDIFLKSGGRYNPASDSWTATDTSSSAPTGRCQHTAVWTGTAMVIWGGLVSSSTPASTGTGGRYSPAGNTWTATSTGAGAPSARYGHTAVWAGSEMIIWGGHATESWGTNTGAVYDPNEDSWRPSATDGNCPPGRYDHSAIWTGTEMVVWGGSGVVIGTYLDNGGGYDPILDTWSVTPQAGAPTPRSGHSAVWTGTEMVIWGGGTTGVSLNTGGRCDLATASWVPTACPWDLPSARSNPTAVWTGSEMIVWGGSSESNARLNTGGRYSPAIDSWTPTSTGANCPQRRVNHTAVWTGSEMILWGGADGTIRYSDGSRYSPGSDTWATTSSGANCPSGRYSHTAVWSGEQMIIWGGYLSGSPYYSNTGGMYNPSTDAWTATSTGTNCPEGRYTHTALWTGTEMLVWGGRVSGSPSYTNTGGRYNPAANTWTALSTGTNCPSGRNGHSAVWSGVEMLVWGGFDGNVFLNSGGRFSPSSNAWTATSTGTGCPTIRDGHSALWTDYEMIVWGGRASSTVRLNTGGRYTPSSDSWTPTSNGADCPTPRTGHRATWTGSRMIVWGGDTSTGGIYCGDPPCVISCEASASPSSGDAPLDVSFTATAAPSNCAGAPTYSWTFGDGGSSSLQNPGHTYSNPGTYTWTMTATADGIPCVRTGIVTLTTACALSCSADASASSGTVPLAVDFTASAIPSNCAGTPTYSWTFGDGGTSTLQNPSHTYTGSGTFTWTMTTTMDGKTCVETGAISVTTPCALSCDASATPASGTAPLAVGFAASATPSNCAGSPAFSWTFGDGGISTQQNPTHTYVSAGTFTWTMTATADGIPCTKSGTITTCGLTCAASASPSAGTAPFAVAFTAGSTPTTCPGSQVYAWDFGDGGSSAEQNPTYTYTVPGTYTWTVTVSQGGATCAKTGTAYVGSLPLSPATLPSGETGLPFSQTITASGGTPPYTFSLFSGGLPGGLNLSGDGVLSGTPLLAGTSTFTVKATDSAGASGYLRYNLTILCPPYLDIYPLSIAPMTPATPVDIGFWLWGGTAISWSVYGDIPPGLTFTTSPASLHGTPTTAGTYSFTVQAVSSYHCVCTKTYTVSVGTCSLTCTASAAPSSGAAPLTVNFSATATPSNCSGSPSFTWVFGDGGTSTQQNPSHTYASAGTYTWTMTATVDSTTCTQTGAVTVSAPPCTLTCAASATPSSGAAPLTVNFSATATPSNCSGSPNFTWVFGDGGTSTQQNPSHTYAAAGTYTWTMTATVDSTTCTKTGTVTVSGPACTLTCAASATPSSGAAPLTVNFSATATPSGCSGTVSYAWNFGDGETSTQKNPSHCYTAAGTYTWTMTSTLGGATCSKSGTVTVTAPPPCQLSCTASASPSSGTAPLAVTFTASATPSHCTGGATFQWTFGDGATSAEQNPGHTYASAGSFTWTMTATADGVTCTRTGTVTATQAPSCTLSCSASATPNSGVAPLQVAFSGSATAVDCAGVPTFSWAFGDGGVSSEEDPSRTYAEPGTYSWTLTVSAGTYTCTQAGEVVVSAPCSLSCDASAAPTSGPAPLVVVFSGSATPQNCAGETTYTWTFGDGAISSDPNPTHTYTADGDYTWTFTATSGGQTCSRTGAVGVSSSPCVVTCEALVTPATGNAPLAVTFTGSATATNCGGPPSYAWSFGDGTTSGEANPSHTYAAAGTYAWTLTVSAGGKSCAKGGEIAVSPHLPGDADNDGVVSIGEVQQAINMFLGLQNPGNGVDCDGDGAVSIGEVQKVINAFLGIPSAC